MRNAAAATPRAGLSPQPPAHIPTPASLSPHSPRDPQSCFAIDRVLEPVSWLVLSHPREGLARDRFNCDVGEGPPTHARLRYGVLLLFKNVVIAENLRTGLRLGVTLKSVTLGNVTMSHRTREARRMRLSHSTMIGLPRAALEN
ncbi:hypothetical protein EVAR_73414_1 [Eumeta japonica]|uniref:Uncharacterized protein n=1 Tax=Eumeta variegata TaxID=151549 RepID=A0A4C1SQM6_EUMVA|nr:hypothetical protein EVAR_73414_1 [Eumeta japonica]